MLLVIIIIIIAVVCVVVAASRSRNAVSRYEWLKMLCEREGIEEYAIDSPFYDDVDESDEYYSVVQAAVEKDIIPAEGEYKGRGATRGEFAALTAMRTVGEGRIQLALGIEEDLTDEDYIDIAMEHGLISSKDIKKCMTDDMCKNLLDKLDELYYSDFLRDDYEDVVYSKRVIEIADSSVIDYSVDFSSITIDSENYDLEEGDIIVFAEKNLKSKISRQVIGENGNGEYQLSSVSLEETVEKLKVSDVVEVGLEDIVNYYQYDESVSIVDTAFFSTDEPIESKGFTVKFETDDNKNIVINFIDNETGAKYQNVSSIKLDEDENYEGEFSINRIMLAGMIDYEVIKGLKYADIALDIDMSAKAGLKSEVEKRIPLFEVPVPLAGGTVTAVIRLNILIDAEGSISVAADIPVIYDVSYDANTGAYNKQRNVSVENKEFLIDCKGQIHGEIEGILNILNLTNVLDAEISVGAIAEANATDRQNGMTCIDVNARAPIVRFAVCDDDEADSLLGKIFDTDRLEVELDAKAKKFVFHSEIYPDGTRKIVDKCTYKEDTSFDAGKEISNKDIEDSEEVATEKSYITYYTQYGNINGITCPKFEFDYPDNWTVADEIYDKDGTMEETILEDGSGAQIIYMHYTRIESGGRVMLCGKTTKTKDSLFEPSYPSGTDTDMSSLGKFVVAEAHVTKSLDMGIDDDYRNVEDDSSYAIYGIIPENRLGDFEDVEGNDGIIELLSFEYPRAGYCFVALPPVDGWTDGQREEMINILASFRVSYD